MAPFVPPRVAPLSFQQRPSVQLESNHLLHAKGQIRLIPEALHLVAVSEDGSHLFVAANTHILDYLMATIDARLRDSCALQPHRHYVLPSRSGSICAIQCTRLCGEPVLVAVVMGAEVHVYFYEGPNGLERPIIVSTAISGRFDCSTWSVSVHPTLPLIAVGCNAHVVSVIDLRLAPVSSAQLQRIDSEAPTSGPVPTVNHLTVHDSRRSSLDGTRLRGVPDPYSIEETLLQRASAPTNTLSQSRALLDFPEAVDLLSSPGSELENGGNAEGNAEGPDSYDDPSSESYDDQSEEPRHLATGGESREGESITGEVISNELWQLLYTGRHPSVGRLASPSGIYHIYGHRHNIPAVAFAPCGDIAVIASASVDNSVRVWWHRTASETTFLGGVMLPSLAWSVQWINIANAPEIDWLSAANLRSLLAGVLKEGIATSHVATGEKIALADPGSLPFLASQPRPVNDVVLLTADVLENERCKVICRYKHALKEAVALARQLPLLCAASPLDKKIDHLHVDAVRAFRLLGHYADGPALDPLPPPLTANCVGCCRTVLSTADRAFLSAFETELVTEYLPLISRRELCKILSFVCDAKGRTFPNLIGLDNAVSLDSSPINPKVLTLLRLALAATLSNAFSYQLGPPDFLLSRRSIVRDSDASPAPGTVASGNDRRLFQLLTRLTTPAEQHRIGADDAAMLAASCEEVNDISRQMFTTYMQTTRVVFLLGLRLSAAWLKKRNFFQHWFARLAPSCRPLSFKRIFRVILGHTATARCEPPDLSTVTAVIQTTLLRAITITGDLYLTAASRSNTPHTNGSRRPAAVWSDAPGDDAMQLAVDVAQAALAAQCTIAETLEGAWTTLQADVEDAVLEWEKQQLLLKAAYRLSMAGQTTRQCGSLSTATANLAPPSSTAATQKNAVAGPKTNRLPPWAGQNTLPKCDDLVYGNHRTEISPGDRGGSNFSDANPAVPQRPEDTDGIYKRCITLFSALGRILRLIRQNNVLLRHVLSRVHVDLLSCVARRLDMRKKRHPLYMLRLHGRQEAWKNISACYQLKTPNDIATNVLYVRPSAPQPLRYARIHLEGLRPSANSTPVIYFDASGSSDDEDEVMPMQPPAQRKRPRRVVTAAVHPVYLCTASTVLNIVSATYSNGPRSASAPLISRSLSHDPVEIAYLPDPEYRVFRHLSHDMMLLVTTTFGLHIVGFTVDERPDSGAAQSVRLQCRSLLEMPFLNIWNLGIAETLGAQLFFQRVTHLRYCNHQGLLVVASQATLPVAVYKVLRCKHTRRPFLILLLTLPCSPAGRTPPAAVPPEQHPLSASPAPCSLLTYAPNGQEFSAAAGSDRTALSPVLPRSLPSVWITKVGSRASSERYLFTQLDIPSPEHTADYFVNDCCPPRQDPRRPDLSFPNNNADAYSQIAGLGIHCTEVHGSVHFLYITFLLHTKRLLRYRLRLPAVTSPASS